MKAPTRYTTKYPPLKVKREGGFGVSLTRSVAFDLEKRNRFDPGYYPTCRFLVKKELRSVSIDVYQIKWIGFWDDFG